MFKNKLFVFLILISLFFFLSGCTDFNLGSLVDCHEGMICSEVDVLRCPQYCSVESDERLNVVVGVVNAETLDFILGEKDIVVSLVVCGQGFCSEENFIELKENPGIITTNYPDWENIENFRVILSVSVDDFESVTEEFFELEKEMELMFYLEPLENDDDFVDEVTGSSGSRTLVPEEELDDGVDLDDTDYDNYQDDETNDVVDETNAVGSGSESSDNSNGENQPTSDEQNGVDNEQGEIEKTVGVGVASGLDNDSAELGLFELVEENIFVIAIIFVIIIILIVFGVFLHIKKSKKSNSGFDAKPKENFDEKFKENSGEGPVEVLNDSFDNNYFKN
jgi:hypothetical protein